MKRLVCIILLSVGCGVNANLFQDGVDGYAGTLDTWLYKTNVTTNYGVNAALPVRWSHVVGQTNPQDYELMNSLLIFKNLPQGVVESATLTLTCTALSGCVDYGNATIEMYEVIKPWGETTSSWNYADGSTNPWQTAGAKGTLDMGQAQIINSLTVRSILGTWNSIGSFEVSFSTNGQNFNQTLKSPGGGLDVPHSSGLSVECSLPVNQINARYLRFRFFIHPWRYIYIGEIDLSVSTTSGVSPLTSMTDIDLRAVVGTQTVMPLVDRFGQWGKDNWHDKIYDVNMLISRNNAEELKYANVTRDPIKSDRFGGSKVLGFSFPVSSNWHLAKNDGRWWFITPDGNPFLFLGLNGFTCYGYNTVEHPDYPEIATKFGWLPSHADANYAPCWSYISPGIWQFNFHAANMILCYGNDYYNRMLDLNYRRAIDWGFTGFVKFNEAQTPLNDIGKPLPFISPAAVTGVAMISSLPDPWDANYESAVRQAVTSLKISHGSAPYYVGMMNYSEYYFGSDATTRVLSATCDQPAKNAFVQQLQGDYVTIQSLNNKLSTIFSSFSQLCTIDMNPYKTQLASDISKFISASSVHFYSAWRNAIDSIDPGRLFLGSCFIPDYTWSCSEEWIDGSLAYCDAIALDYYTRDPNYIINNYITPIAVPADKPVLVGEYNFTTTDRGFLPYLSSVVDTQQERGEYYKQYNETLFNHPNFVGAGWFQFRDQQMLGRDIDALGESSNGGLVDTCNYPYYDAIEIIKQTNKLLYFVHAGINPFASCQTVIETGFGSTSDMNGDCKVDLADLAIFSQAWMHCTDPQNGSCFE